MTRIAMSRLPPAPGEGAAAVVSGDAQRRHLLGQACRDALPEGRVSELAELTDLVFMIAADALDFVVLDLPGLPAQSSALPMVLRGLAPSVRLAVIDDDGAGGADPGYTELADADEVPAWIESASGFGRLR